MSNQYWIAGRPATFATKFEASWKNEILYEIGNRKNQNRSLTLKFNIKKENYNKYAFDIDNLCDPVFTVLTSKLGWYNRTQANIISWRASKHEDENEGVIINDVETMTLILKRQILFLMKPTKVNFLIVQESHKYQLGYSNSLISTR